VDRRFRIVGHGSLDTPAWRTHIDNIVVNAIMTSTLSFYARGFTFPPAGKHRQFGFVRKKMSSTAARLYKLIAALRISFNRLKGVAEELHRDLGINVSMRGVLESLAGEVAKTVPVIAREKGVSRQHIQVNVDALLQEGMVETRDNVAHQRSPLIALTTKGKRVFAEIRRREAAILESLAEGFAPTSLDDAARVLESLNARLIQRERKRYDDDEDA